MSLKFIYDISLKFLKNETVKNLKLFFAKQNFKKVRNIHLSWPFLKENHAIFSGKPKNTNVQILI